MSSNGLPASGRAVRVRAPGKINVSLRVGPARDDGYHTVASIYLAVSLYEDVTAMAVPGGGITVSMRPPDPQLSGSGPTGGQERPADVPLDGNNLAVRAAVALQQAAEVNDGVHLELVKRVPVAGGMGGGSADAAAALAACNVLWDCGLDQASLSRLAAGLGADVPFALLGGAAVGLGIGEQLTPAPATASFHWVLVPTPAGLSTPQVYAELDRIRTESGEPVADPTADADVLHALESGDPSMLARVLHNDLEPAALALAPPLADILARGLRHGALSGIVSGSGPTVAFLAGGAEDAGRLAHSLTRDGLDAVAVHGPAIGASILSSTSTGGQPAIHRRK